ncbi:MAG: EAL domain-containing protein [Clostridia bacterium]
MNKEETIKEQNTNKRFQKLLYIAFIIMLIIVGALLTVLTWETSINATEERMIELAESTEACLSKEYISKLTGSEDDLVLEEYIALKISLISFIEVSNDIRFAYLYTLKNGSLYFLLDSEPADSADYSPPGQLYYEASPIEYMPFENGNTMITKPTTDRWGIWVSVLVPVSDPSTGRIIAVFGIDCPKNVYYADAIRETLSVALICACISLIFIFMQNTYTKNVELRSEKQKLLATDEKLRESQTLFKAIFDQAMIGIAIGGGDSYILSSSSGLPSINPMFEKILGRSKEELTSMKWAELTHPDDLKLDLENFRKFQAGEIDGYDMEKRYMRPDGTEVWVQMFISPLKFNNNSNISHLCVIEDISKRRNMEKALFDSERSKNILFDNLPGVAYRCRLDKDWTMLFMSQGCSELTGYTPESLINNRDISFNELIVPAYREKIWNKWIHLINTHGKVQDEYEIITASGESKWLFDQGQGVYDEKGTLIAVEGMMIDITKRKQQEIKIRYINEHDQLTGLYNQRYFIDSLNRELGNSTDAHRAVLLINIRRFSLLNLTHGYLYTEKLILELSKKLSSLSDDDHMLFHLTTDRFAFYVDDYEDDSELVSLCENIIASLNETIEFRANGGNIGIVKIGHRSDTAESILKNAAIAAESAGGAQAFGYCFFDSRMELKILREEVIKNDLLDICNGSTDVDFYLEYHPLLDLKTDRIYGFEALARLKSSELGIVPPIEFISIAEKKQIIVPLGRKITFMACSYLRKLIEMGFTDMKMSVNISAMQILREDFITDLLDIIEKTHITPYNLCIEVTESVFSDSYDLIKDRLHKAKELGIESAIDDFGTGYSSLSRERELDVDYMKIDKSFIDKLMVIDSDKTITGSIIKLAHTLGQKVIAEGVEYEKQKEYLINNNCDYMQGYLFSRPVSMDDATELLIKINKDNK